MLDPPKGAGYGFQGASRTSASALFSVTMRDELSAVSVGVPPDKL